MKKQPASLVHRFRSAADNIHDVHDGSDCTEAILRERIRHRAVSFTCRCRLPPFRFVSIDIARTIRIPPCPVPISGRSIFIHWCIPFRTIISNGSPTSRPITTTRTAICSTGRVSRERSRPLSMLGARWYERDGSLSQS